MNNRPLTKQRIIEKITINPTTGCWNWVAFKEGGGYGRITACKKQYAAHRAAYIVFIGPIPAGKCVLHACDNPSCVNPKHLWVGTHKDNAVDRTRKGRGIKGEQTTHSKLRAEDIPTIRHRRAVGETYQAIANDYGVSLQAVRQIAKRNHWKHIQ